MVSIIDIYSSQMCFQNEILFKPIGECYWNGWPGAGMLWFDKYTVTKICTAPNHKKNTQKSSKYVRDAVHNNNHVKVEPIQFWYVVKIKKKTRKETMIKVV